VCIVLSFAILNLFVCQPPNQTLARTSEFKVLAYLLPIKINLLKTHCRLNSPSPGPPGSTKQSTPAAEGSGSGTRKRKIVESEEISSSFVSDQYAATAAGKVGVEIHSVDPEGMYVRLFNNTDKVCRGETYVIHL